MQEYRPGPLYNLTIAESLGADNAPENLVYQADSAVVFVGEVPTAVAPEADGNKLTFRIPGAVTSQQTVLIVYCARQPGAEYYNRHPLRHERRYGKQRFRKRAAGAAAAAAEATVALAQYADLAVTKAVDKQNVSRGDALTYTFTLLNTGSQPSVDTVLTDTLPDGFIPSLVTASVGGVTTVYTDDMMNLTPKPIR